MISETGNAKIADFGLATPWTKGNEIIMAVAGTPLYMSPQLLSHYQKFKKNEMGRGWNYKVDNWSMGCVTIEITTCQKAFEKLSEIGKKRPQVFIFFTMISHSFHGK